MTLFRRSSSILVFAVCLMASLQRSVCFVILHRVPVISNALAAAHPLASMSNLYHNIGSMFLSDTSLSEEDVLDVVGQTADLPDPLIVIGLAAVVVIGVGVLQFSLGDLTKEEGQARVRDFLQTRRDTERKRGYFDD